MGRAIAVRQSGHLKPALKRLIPRAVSGARPSFWQSGDTLLDFYRAALYIKGDNLCTFGGLDERDLIFYR
jgi:hypothetical protein